jgi:hypothetical protein
MKAIERLYAILERVGAVIHREGLACETRGIDHDGGNEYTITVHGLPANVAILVQALERDEVLYDPRVMEDLREIPVEDDFTLVVSAPTHW